MNSRGRANVPASTGKDNYLRRLGSPRPVASSGERLPLFASPVNFEGGGKMNWRRGFFWVWLIISVVESA